MPLECAHVLQDQKKKELGHKEIKEIGVESARFHHTVILLFSSCTSRRLVVETSQLIYSQNFGNKTHKLCVVDR